MLGDADAFGGFSVDDIQRTRDFYEARLALEVSELNGLLQLKLRSGATIVVYPKENHDPRHARSSISRWTTSTRPSTS
jgi:hypothetical protein